MQHGGTEHIELHRRAGLKRERAERGVWMAILLAAMTLLVTSSSAPSALALCCVCEGFAGLSPSCFPVQAGPSTCSECASFCATVGATMRQCCDSSDNCGNGVADGCATTSIMCLQQQTGFGDCDGTCAGAPPTETPTETPTVTPTATATGTHTPTSTPTSTPAPNGADCIDPLDCVSGNCVDDTCCAQPSCPAGQSCDNPGNVGTCSPDPIAPAPALSRNWLVLALALLAAIAAVATARRRRDC